MTFTAYLFGTLIDSVALILQSLRATLQGGQSVDVTSPVFDS
jgi:hypothetical protein